MRFGRLGKRSPELNSGPILLPVMWWCSGLLFSWTWTPADLTTLQLAAPPLAPVLAVAAREDERVWPPPASSLALHLDGSRSEPARAGGGGAFSACRRGGAVVVAVSCPGAIFPRGARRRGYVI
uniref:Uncharacterized protein n=1 Tax=Oryza rufipogon TaxID=4529 RepID=A0A0E0PBT5_ORYRU